MITAKQKRSRGKLLALLIILALIVGGTVTLIIQQTSSSQSVPPDFTMTLHKGLATDDTSSWNNLTSTDTILNGTSGLNNLGLRIIIAISSSGTFNGFIRFNVSGLPPGITPIFRPLVIRPVAAGNAVSALTLRASNNVTSQAAPYNITLTATSRSPEITHAVSFNLRVRTTKMFWYPSVVNVNRGDKFRLTLKLSDVYNVTGFQASAGFNSTLLTALTNGTSFNPDFTTYGYVVHNPLSCSWADNATGTIGPSTCPVAAVITNQCASAPCINANSMQTYNLLNQTFVANASYNGTVPVTLSNDIVTEALTEGTGNVFQDPHHTVGDVVTIAETMSPMIHVSHNVTSPMVYGLLSFFALLPLIITRVNKAQRYVTRGAFGLTDKWLGLTRKHSFTWRYRNILRGLRVYSVIQFQKLLYSLPGSSVLKGFKNAHNIQKSQDTSTATSSNRFLACTCRCRTESPRKRNDQSLTGTHQCRLQR